MPRAEQESASSTPTTTASARVGTRACHRAARRFDDGRLNIVVEGGERFRLVQLTEGRSLQTGLVEPLEDEVDAADPEDSDDALKLFHRLVELTGAEVEEPRLSAEHSFELAGRFEFAPEANRSCCSAPPSGSGCTCWPISSPAPPCGRARARHREPAHGNGKVDLRRRPAQYHDPDGR